MTDLSHPGGSLARGPALVRSGPPTRPKSPLAAPALGLSERQTYTLLRRYRDAGGTLTALLPGRSSGGRITLIIEPTRPRFSNYLEVFETGERRQVDLLPFTQTESFQPAQPGERCQI